MARHTALTLALGAALAGAMALTGCVAAFPIPLGSTDESAQRGVQPADARTIGESAFAGPWDAISFETRSWGNPAGAWRLAPDGSGSWTDTERPDGAALGDYRLAWHEIAADPATHAAVRSMIEALPYPPPTSEGCAKVITDQPYGTLRLQKGASALELTYNFGCLDEAYAEYVSGLRRANDLVEGLGRASPVTRREGPDGTVLDV